MRTTFILVLGIAALLNACASPSTPTDGYTCPVTRLPETPFIPPIAAEYEGFFWYGTPSLWTSLPADGVWRELPQDQNGYVQKVVFWQERFDPLSEPDPDLKLSGRRLDAGAPGFTEDLATHGWDDSGAFMLIGISIPTTGCWEFTADYQGEVLTFIVQVEPKAEQ